MEVNGKLVKTKDGFYVLNDENGNLVNVKLSLKNCQAIERGYDLDELSKDIFPDSIIFNDFWVDGKYESEEFNLMPYQWGFKVGFQKRDEMLSDKIFSEKDMMVFFKWADQQMRSYCGKTSVQLLQEWKSLQQTKWDITYSMRKKNIDELRESKEGFLHNPNLWIYETDSDGCVILKRK